MRTKYKCKYELQPHTQNTSKTITLNTNIYTRRNTIWIKLSTYIYIYIYKCIWCDALSKQQRKLNYKMSQIKTEQWVTIKILSFVWFIQLVRITLNTHNIKHKHTLANTIGNANNVYVWIFCPASPQPLWNLQYMKTVRPQADWVSSEHIGCRPQADWAASPVQTAVMHIGCRPQADWVSSPVQTAVTHIGCRQNAALIYKLVVKAHTAKQHINKTAQTK